MRARVKAPPPRAGRSTLPLAIDIDGQTARISVDPETWSLIQEPVLFAIAQYWRFVAIDRTLQDLSDWARQDSDQTAGWRRTLARTRSSALRTRRRALQSLILDLPDFEGPMVNPRIPASARNIRLYRRLALWLGLERLRREIDERVEVVESIFDSLAESLNHFQSLACQIALELFIVAVLLLDVGLYCYSALAE